MNTNLAIPLASDEDPDTESLNLISFLIQWSLNYLKFTTYIIQDYIVIMLYFEEEICNFATILDYVFHLEYLIIILEHNQIVFQIKQLLNLSINNVEDSKMKFSFPLLGSLRNVSVLRLLSCLI